VFWSASHFTHPSIKLIWGCVGPRVDTVTLQNRTNSCYCRNTNPGQFSPSPVATLTALWQLPEDLRNLILCPFSFPLKRTFGPLKYLLNIQDHKQNICALALFFTASIAMRRATSHHVSHLLWLVAHFQPCCSRCSSVDVVISQSEVHHKYSSYIHIKKFWPVVWN
jgi:hypothetical protein